MHLINPSHSVVPKQNLLSLLTSVSSPSILTSRTSLSSIRTMPPINNRIDELRWNFYTVFKRAYLPDGSQKGRKHLICLICGWSNTFSNNAIEHAERKHPELTRENDSSIVSFTSTPASTQASLDGYVELRANDISLRNVFNEQRYTEAIVGLLTRRRVAFSAVNWEELKSLALACNPAIEDRLITSRPRIMRIIDANFSLYMEQLKTVLHESTSMIHISSDLWTSPHRHGMLAVCGQWVDSYGVLRKALLGLLECPFNHSGDAQAELIMAVIRRLGVKRIGYHTGDNATSNDTCLASLETKLKEELDVNFPAKKRRVRCLAHIINLSLQSFLLARSKEALDTALIATADVSEADLIGSFASNLTVASST